MSLYKSKALYDAASEQQYTAAGRQIQVLLYFFMSRHEVHSMNTHTLQNAGR